MPKEEKKPFELVLPVSEEKVVEKSPQEARGASVQTKSIVSPVHYEPVLWKGVKQVFRCSKCKTCRDDTDSIILHVITHVSDKKEREKLFDMLVKEMEK